MSESQALRLEILSGPLDGAEIRLEADTEWRRMPGSPLSFPWDEELGEPQARFTQDEAGWGIEGLPSPHGTYRISPRRAEQIETRTALNAGDILKGSKTWIRVK
jgi:hypothetical protein